MPVAFQQDAFQTEYPGNAAFQGFLRAVQIAAFGVSPSFRSIPSIARGGALTLLCTIKDPLTIPNELFSPASVRIFVLDPEDEVIVNGVEMDEYDVGKYSYLFQSTNDLTLGAYTGYVIANDDAEPLITFQDNAFQGDGFQTIFNFVTSGYQDVVKRAVLFHLI